LRGFRKFGEPQISAYTTDIESVDYAQEKDGASGTDIFSQFVSYTLDELAALENIGTLRSD